MFVSKCEVFCVFAADLEESPLFLIRKAFAPYGFFLSIVPNSICFSRQFSYGVPSIGMFWISFPSPFFLGGAFIKEKASSVRKARRPY